MRILIYGFGRMGLTHYTILNYLLPDSFFFIVEPNTIVRNLSNKNIKAEFYKNDKKFIKPFDIVLITTPPFLHSNLLKSCKLRGDKRIFIEKPFGGSSNTNLKISSYKNIFVGYVLRFNPCIQWIKKNIDLNSVEKIYASYLSNTIHKKPTGWRNGKFSGVLNEMGSHIVDLISYITNESSFDILKSNITSIVSDVDDIVEADIKSKLGIPVSIYLNWVDKNIRKPIFQIKIYKNDKTELHIDQQMIKKYDSSGNLIEKISVTDLCEKVPYYLRGVDFTNQMVSLITNHKILATGKEAIKTNIILNKIMYYENNIRR